MTLEKEIGNLLVLSKETGDLTNLEKKILNLLTLEKEMAYLKGFAKGRNFDQTIIALKLAKQYHNGQLRKTGEPYIMHPVRVCSNLLTLGIYDDTTLGASLIHDIVEDTSANISILSSNGINNEVIKIVDLLTKRKQIPLEAYYKSISEDRRASLIKISDRCHNISTMVEAFTPEKIRSYVEETHKFIIPLCKLLEDNCPEYSDQIYNMLYYLENTLKIFDHDLKVS